MHGIWAIYKDSLSIDSLPWKETLVSKKSFAWEEIVDGTFFQRVKVFILRKVVNINNRVSSN